MDNWFTIEQIDRDTFSISEYKHWEETHCYLLCGEKCAILIDTGLGVSNIRKIVDSLTELPVMAVTTHVHWDHIGGHKYFDTITYIEQMDKKPEDYSQEDDKGLSFVDYYILPHYLTAPFKKVTEKILAEFSDLNICPISNHQAIIVNDESSKVICTN